MSLDLSSGWSSRWLLLLTWAALLRCGCAQGPVITSISGCVDVGSSTMNCSFPAWLTVRGSGFLTNISAAAQLYRNSPQYYITPLPALSPLAIQSGWTRPYLQADTGYPANDTFFVFLLANIGQGMYEIDTAITLSVSLGSTVNPPLSAPFLGFSISSYPQPNIDSISGCPQVSADGRLVSGCLPDRDQLTIMGSGFLSWQYSPLHFFIGSSSSFLYLRLGTLPSTYNYIINDSCITVTLATMYRNLLTAGDFGGPPLPLYIQEWWTMVATSALQIQFAPLPLPYYTRIVPYNMYSTLPLCVWAVNNSAIVNCTAGWSGIQIWGHYLYEIAVSINGQPLTTMVMAQQEVTLAALVTPLFNFQPDVLYNLTIAAASGTLTVPNFISFAGTPQIVGASCRDPSLFIADGNVGCQGGETLYLNGPNLPPAGSAFTVSIFSWAIGYNVTCANPRYTSAVQLACDVPTPAVVLWRGWDRWYLDWSSGLSLLIASRYTTWENLLAPRIRALTAVGGCGDVVNSTNMTLSGCGGGEVLTFYGSNFLFMPFTMRMQPVTTDLYWIINNWAQSVPCADFTVVDNATATCELPLLSDSPLLQYGAPMMMFMLNRTGSSTLVRSNSVFFTFTPGMGPGPATPPDSASDWSSQSTAIVVSVVVGVVGLAGLVCLAVLLLQWRALRKARAGNLSPGHDSAATENEPGMWWQRMASRATPAVELEEY